jgi:hypothetical protein
MHCRSVHHQKRAAFRASHSDRLPLGTDGSNPALSSEESRKPSVSAAGQGLGRNRALRPAHKPVVPRVGVIRQWDRRSDADDAAQQGLLIRHDHLFEGWPDVTYNNGHVLAEEGSFRPRECWSQAIPGHAPEGSPLPPNVAAELERDIARLRLVIGQIKQIEEASSTAIRRTA